MECSTFFISSPAVTPTQSVGPTKPSGKRGANVGLAVGLTIAALVILTVVVVIAGFFIYKKFGKYKVNYESIPEN